MSGPWEKYAAQPEPGGGAPWEKYAAVEPEPQYKNFGERALAERGGTFMPAPGEFQIDVGPSALGSIPGAVSKTAQVVRAFEREGVPPSLAATGGLFSKTAAKVGEALPGGETIVGGPLRKAVSAAGDAVSRAVGKFGTGGDSESAGSTMQRGIEAWKGRFSAEAANKYAQVENLIPPNMPTVLSNTTKVLQDVTSRFPSSQALSEVATPSIFPKIADALNKAGGRLSWPEANALRSFIGRKLGEPALVSDIDRASLKRVYSALSDDLGAAAKASGPQAEAAWRDATAFYKAGSERLSTHLSDIFGAKSPEAAYGKVMSAAKSGSGQNLDRLRELKATLTPDEFDDVASTVLRDLGKPPPGSKFAGKDFSPTTFSTNWNKLAPEARDILFGSGARRAAVNDIVTISDKLKGVEAAGNPSGSARWAGFGAFAGGAAIDPVSTAAATATGLGIGRAATSPTMARIFAGNLPTAGEMALQTGVGAADLARNKQARKPAEDLIDMLLRK